MPPLAPINISALLLPLTFSNLVTLVCMLSIPGGVWIKSDFLARLISKLEDSPKIDDARQAAQVHLIASSSTKTPSIQSLLRLVAINFSAKSR